MIYDFPPSCDLLRLWALECQRDFHVVTAFLLAPDRPPLLFLDGATLVLSDPTGKSDLSAEVAFSLHPWLAGSTR